MKLLFFSALFFSIEAVGGVMKPEAIAYDEQIPIYGNNTPTVDNRVEELQDEAIQPHDEIADRSAVRCPLNFRTRIGDRYSLENYRYSRGYKRGLYKESGCVYILRDTWGYSPSSNDTWENRAFFPINQADNETEGSWYEETWLEGTWAEGLWEDEILPEN